MHVVALVSQFIQGGWQEEQMLLVSSLKVLSGHSVAHVRLFKKFPEMQLVQVVALVMQFKQGV